MQAEHVPLYVHGHGAVSCAGMDAHSLYQACKERKQIPAETLDRETGSRTISYAHRPLDTKALRAVMPKHPRLRRASNVTKFAVTAAHQAIGEERLAKMKTGELRIGIVMSFMNGCVNYSNRFYGEVLENPKFASPILFPETVYNAPSSHLSAILGSMAPNDTLVGDGAELFTALELATEWLERGDCDFGIVSELPDGSSISTVLPRPTYLQIDGVGISRHAVNADAAQRLVDWMLSDYQPGELNESVVQNAGVAGWRDEEARLLAERAGYR